MLVYRSDAQREHAHGPARRLPDTHVGTFSQAHLDEAKVKACAVISMKKIGSGSSPSNTRARPLAGGMAISQDSVEALPTATLRTDFDS